MVSPRPSNARLNLEDFRRLGVRPQEYRLGVIRQAAARSTAGLAAQQLSSPTTHAGLQLSRVATSAYRLLDPRRRHDTQLRARIGRILPQTLSWASQTGFHNEVSDFQVSPKSGDRAPFARSSLSDAKLIEMLDLDSSTEPKAKQVGQQNWTSSLSDADLLSSTPMSRRVARLQSPKRIPWLGLAASGLACGLVLSFIFHRSTADGPATVTTQATAPESGSSEQDLSSEGTPADAQPSPALDAPGELAVSPGDGVVASGDGVDVDIALEDQSTAAAAVAIQSESNGSMRDIVEPDRAVDVGRVEQPEETLDINGPFIEPSGRQLVPDSMRELFSNVPGKLPAEDAELAAEMEPAAEPEVDAPIDLPPMPVADQTASDSERPLLPTANSDADYAPDLLISEEEMEAALEPIPIDSMTLLPGGISAELQPGVDDTIGASSSDLSLSSEEVDELVEGSSEEGGEWLPGLGDIAMDGDQSLDSELPDSTSPIEQRLPVPSEESVGLVRQELLQSIPELKPNFEAPEGGSQLQEMSLLVEQFEPGSTEYWVAQGLVAEAAWLVETLPEVAERLKSLEEVYDVSDSALMAQTFVSIASDAGNAVQPSTRAHLLDCGLRLADRLLIATAPSDCDEVVALLPSLIESGSSDAETFEQYIASFEKSSKKISKQANTVARAKEKVGGPSVADTKVLGRYHCLMLRRWDVGLTWLTEASDSAISRAAKKELELPANPTAEEVYDVAKLWVLVADRASDRPANSIRLHVLDLIRSVQPRAAGLTKLNLGRLMDQVQALVPSHLLPIQAAGFGVGTSSFSERSSSLGNRQSNASDARLLDLSWVS